MDQLKHIATTAKALSKPLNKLIEVVANGIGATGRPLMVVIHAHAEGRAALIREGYRYRLARLRANNERELANVLESEAHQLPTGDPSDIPALVEASEGSELAAAHSMETEQQAKRRSNVVTIAAEAADAIGDEVAAEPVDPDWIARFFTVAQDVSNEELQRLWGQILAGEVERPGTVPLRTLDILRNLTPTEAGMFQELVSRLTTEGAYMPYGSARLPDHTLAILQDSGLVETGHKNARWRPQSPDADTPNQGAAGFAHLRYGDRYIVEIRTNSMQFDVSAILLRPSAYPLLKVVKAPPNVEYVKGLVDQLNAEPYFDAFLVDRTLENASEEGTPDGEESSGA